MYKDFRTYFEKLAAMSRPELLTGESPRRMGPFIRSVVFAASVSGGLSNTASGRNSSVSGGWSRSVSGAYDWAAGSLFEDY